MTSISIKSTALSRIFITMLLLVFTVFSPFFMKTARADSASAVNRRALTAYQKKYNTLRRQSRYIANRHLDVTGDGVQELLVERLPGGGSGYILEIYTYKNGTVRQILAHSEYGLEKIVIYKKTGTLVFYGAGHRGVSWARYFRLRSGKYRLTAEKHNGGGSWKYFVNDRKASKSNYNNTTTSLKKGKSYYTRVERWNKSF